MGVLSFADRLAAALDAAGSPACVGIDPVLDRLPEAIRPAGDASIPESLLAFSVGVVDAVRPHARVVKFQSACYERFGEGGVAALRRAIAHARSRDMVVILDAKRGDIGISAEHYAAAAFTPPYDADALTVSPYLGPDTLTPYLAAQGRGLFVLVRTSNPGSDAVQSLRLEDGRTIAECMGDMVANLGAGRIGARGVSDVGAVVGATKARDGAALRARMPHQVFLVPGFGAQGGGVDDVRPMLRPNASSPAELGVLVTASRSVIFPEAHSTDWTDDVRAAAAEFATALTELSR